MTYSAAVSKIASTISRAALCVLLGLCLLAGLLPRAEATSLSPFLVTRTADDTNPNSLRAAIAAASASGGTVTFAIPTNDPGYSSTANTDTITLSLGPLVVPASLSIAGPTVPSTTVVVSGGGNSRVFSVTSGTVAFSNLTIMNGYANTNSFSFPEPEGGGGILNTATLALTGCTVTGNTFVAPSGGGINNSGSGARLILTDCIVSQNRNSFSVGNGGGIANTGMLVATGCLISGNSLNGFAPSGGGLLNGGMATLNSCILSSNSTGGFTQGFQPKGGGAANTGTLTLNNCLVTGNTASVFGGGLFNDTGGTLNLSACTISSNQTNYGSNPSQRNYNPGFGGGITSFGTAFVTDCLVVGNRSDTIGGMDNGGTLTLINSTFTANLALTLIGSTTPASGGLFSGPATLLNDIFYMDAGAEITVASGTTGPTVTSSDVQQATGVYPGTGNINLDPQFVRTPDPNASPADNGDEHLLLTSPAVHAGTNGAGVPLTDIEGTLRPTPPAKPSMGAYEVPGSASGFSAQGGFLLTGTQNTSTGPQIVAKFLPGTTPAGRFTAAVDTGDGSVIPGVILSDPTTAGVFDVTISHTYAAYGAFTITAVISGPSGTPTATVTSTANIQPAQVATVVTSQVSVFRGGFYYNRFTKRYSQTVTIKNTSSAAITGPLSLTLDNLTPGAAAVSPTGTTQYAPPAGSPYFTVQAGSLAPGATTSVFLQLTNTATTSQIDYIPRVLAGPGTR